MAGTKVVAVILGNANLEFPSTARRSILYLDSKEGRAQQGVLNLFSRNYGNLLGEIIAVRNAPIRFEMGPDRANVRLADTVVALRRAVLPTDAHPGSSLWYDPFIPLSNRTLAVTLHNEFWGEGLRHQWRTTYPPAITGFFGSFSLAARQ